MAAANPASRAVVPTKSNFRPAAPFQPITKSAESTAQPIARHFVQNSETLARFGLYGPTHRAVMAATTNTSRIDFTFPRGTIDAQDASARAPNRIAPKVVIPAISIRGTVALHAA